MIDKQLCPQQLEAISDDLLDGIIEEQAQKHFDDEFQSLGWILSLSGHRDIYLAIEERINSLCIELAEAAFAAGHNHGYTSAALDMIEELRPIPLAG